ncbi:histidine kinase dimerization/phosphoacceptor domain -containing protein [Xanthovirga aplysinae]|uniref:histidine kinase dimerization/phosphoacceptor domain -containing protein n=1 Tax=Xanthovirga aplysinae TaxID=2529853 RepID=UPI0012BD099F|nr:histidine kinase dimerization/phosphoacceptor domain -containing protein [Xanthovirga aplysinae]MTI33639.1 tetratricopeptide repeat protein [Xanthovirga aplysinae]
MKNFSLNSHAITIYFVFILWAFSFNASSQNINTIDSLIQLSVFEKNDSVKQQLNYEIAKKLNNGTQSLQYSKKALELAKKLGNKIEIAHSNVELANDYRRIGDLTKAIDAVFIAAKIFQEVENFRGLGAAYNQIGMLYWNQKNYPLAIQYGKEAIEVDEKLGNPQVLGNDYLNLGEAFRLQGNLKEATHHFEKALQLYTKADFQMGIAYALGNLGLVYATQNEEEKAEKELAKATKVLTQLGDFYPIAIFNIEMGKVALENNNQRKALKYTQKGYEIAVFEGLKQQIQDASELLYQIHEELGHTKEALHFVKQYYAYKDSLVNEETIQKMADLRTEFEISKKQEEVEVLEASNKRRFYANIILAAVLLIIGILSFSLYLVYRRQKRINRLLELQSQQLEANKAIIENSLKEKEALLKEIHHRVKNNLQIISSLLNLQANKFESQLMVEAFQEGQNRIQSIALIHQKLYQREDLAYIAFQEYLDQLSESVLSSMAVPEKKISTQIEAGEVVMDMDTAVPLGLIVNELLTNSVKYAFKNQENGNIAICIELQENNNYRLHYKDDGCGLPDNFTTESSSSLGLKLVKILTRQLSGNFDYYNEKGANFVITFHNGIQHKKIA